MGEKDKTGKEGNKDKERKKNGSEDPPLQDPSIAIAPRDKTKRFEESEPG